VAKFSAQKEEEKILINKKWPNLQPKTEENNLM
jgi:hypothetical protein